MVQETAVKSETPWNLCNWQAACSSLMNRATTSALLKEPDGGGRGVDSVEPEVLSCVAHRHRTSLVATQRRTAWSATRDGCIASLGILATHLDMDPKQEMKPDAEVVTLAIPLLSHLRTRQ